MEVSITGRNRPLTPSTTASRNALPLAIRRDDTYVPFHSGSTLEDGDRLITLHVPETPPALHYDRFDRLAAQCPVLDIAQPLATEEFFSMVADVLAPRLVG